MKIRLSLFSIVMAIALFCTSPLSHADQQDRPNVLMIAIDDLNDWVGCLSTHPQAATPNIDRIAARGMLFTNAHCQAPICGPSRASLLSGLYPHTTGVYQQPKSNEIEEDQTYFRGHLLPEYFKSHGYRTLAVGKITHGYRAKTAFDVYGGKFGGSGPKPADEKRFNYFLPDVPWTGTQTDWGAFPETDQQMPDHLAADWAIEQLSNDFDKPFFLAVGFVRPHVPFYVPQKWFDEFPLDDIRLPDVRNDDLHDVPEISRQIHEVPKYPSLSFLQKNDNEQFRKCVQAYLACTMFVDHQVGRVLDALDNSQYANNTVIVLFSDHGYHLGEKDRVSKHSLWEESTRVPLVFIPAKSDTDLDVARGRRSSKPVGLIDIYPTLTELCRLPDKESNQGRSLKPLLLDPNADWRRSIITTYARGNHSIRTETYRYIRYEDGSEELYDHAMDPNEFFNLAKDSQFLEVIERLRDELPIEEAIYHSSTRSAPINRWFERHFQQNGVGESR